MGQWWSSFNQQYWSFEKQRVIIMIKNYFLSFFFFAHFLKIFILFYKNNSFFDKNGAGLRLTDSAIVAIQNSDFKSNQMTVGEGLQEFFNVYCNINIINNNNRCWYSLCWFSFDCWNFKSSVTIFDCFFFKKNENFKILFFFF